MVAKLCIFNPSKKYACLSKELLPLKYRHKQKKVYYVQPLLVKCLVQSEQKRMSKTY